jgi:hypothetical protein
MLIEAVEILPLHRQIGQQLHPAPAHGDPHLGPLDPQPGQRLLQLALADEAPGTDKIEIDCNVQGTTHALSSRFSVPVRRSAAGQLTSIKSK